MFFARYSVRIAHLYFDSFFVCKQTLFWPSSARLVSTSISALLSNFHNYIRGFQGNSDLLSVKSFISKMVDPTDEPIDLSMVDPDVSILQIKKLYNNSSLCIKYCDSK